MASAQAERKTLRRRLAPAFVRFGLRLDAEALIEGTAVGDALVEGRLAAYTR